MNAWARPWMEKAIAGRASSPPQHQDQPLLSFVCHHTFPPAPETKQVATESISKELHEIFNYALVWGRSTKYDPQRCGFQHEVR